VCRLVLSTGGAIDLLNRSQQFAAALERAGVIKQRPKEPAPVKPN
jgi:hypothetical protein